MDDQHIKQQLEELKLNVQQLDGKIDGLREAMAMMTATRPLYQARVETHQTLLYGNPKDDSSPGLVKRVDRLEGWVSLASWGLKALWGVVGALCVGVLTKILMN